MWVLKNSRLLSLEQSLCRSSKSEMSQEGSRILLELRNRWANSANLPDRYERRKVIDCRRADNYSNSGPGKRVKLSAQGKPKSNRAIHLIPGFVSADCVHYSWIDFFARMFGCGRLSKSFRASVHRGQIDLGRFFAHLEAASR